MQCCLVAVQFQARQEILEEELDKTRRKEGTLSVEVSKEGRGVKQYSATLSLLK